MELTIGKDKKTGFPCIKKPDSDYYVGLFPVTKVQVRKAMNEGAYGTDGWTEIQQKLELGDVEQIEISGFSQSIFPGSVNLLKSIPNNEINKRNLVSLVASNLSLFNKQDVVPQGYNITFPRPDSDWGIFMNWFFNHNINGAIPSDEKWFSIHKYFRTFCITKALVKNILGSKIPWDDEVENLLMSFKNHIDENKLGLPFMGEGFFELITNTAKYVSFVQNGENGDFIFPKAAGKKSTLLWPMINNRSKGIIPDYLEIKRTSPVVSLRLLFTDKQIKDTTKINC